jgi:hypothetical protein
VGCGVSFGLDGALAQQRHEGVGDCTPDQFDAGVARNGNGRLIPENHVAWLA